jgi:hypothetical protein
MKLNKVLVGSAIAASLIFGSAVTAGAVTPTPAPSASASPAPISEHVHKHDRKAINDARKSAGEYAKKHHKLDRLPANATDAAALAAFQAAMDAWKLANADSIAAIKQIEKTFHDSVRAADKAVHDADRALQVARAELRKANKSADAAAIGAATYKVSSATAALATARTSRDAVRTEALKARTDAITALGPLPEKPAKPVLTKLGNEGKGKEGKDKPKKKGD